jgi:hypothetical protein
MATFSKIPFSGSTNGRGVLVSASATPGTLIHTAVSGSASFDEVWIYCQNTSASTAFLDVEFGGTSTADQIEIAIPGESGLILVVPGLFLNNSLPVRAYSSILNVLSMHGYVNRVT